ncbi:MAG: lipocalin family protein [Nitrosomonas sp.]|nr:lipocalin family protein [Nitrosomonas sp.]
MIEIPSRNIYLEVKSISENSEFDAMLTTYNIYWEGAVKVQGSHTGLGFMELYYMDNKR